MSTASALKTLADARKTLTEDGQPVYFRRYSETVYDPTTGKNTYTLLVQYNSVGYPSRYRAYEIANGLVETSDTRLICAVPASGEIPKHGDLVNIDTIDYRVQNVQSITESGVTVLYIIQCRA